MTDIIQTAAFILIVTNLMFLCIYITLIIKKYIKNRNNIMEIENSAKFLKTDIESLTHLIDTAIKEMKSIFVMLDIDKAKIKNDVALEENITDDTLLLLDKSFHTLNEYIGVINGLKYIISSTRTKSAAAILQLDDMSFCNEKKIESIKEILMLAVDSCDNADNVVNESYLIAEKGRAILQTVRLGINERNKELSHKGVYHRKNLT